MFETANFKRGLTQKSIICTTIVAVTLLLPEPTLAQTDDKVTSATTKDVAPSLSAEKAESRKSWRDLMMLKVKPTEGCHTSAYPPSITQRHGQSRSIILVITNEPIELLSYKIPIFPWAKGCSIVTAT
jgi:hypothetical protein